MLPSEIKIQKISTFLQQKSGEELEILWNEKLQKYGEDEILFCMILASTMLLHEKTKDAQNYSSPR